MKVESRLFQTETLRWARSFPIVNFSAKLSEDARIDLGKVLRVTVPFEIVEELTRVCYVAGYISGSDDDLISYDGSRISAVNPSLKNIEGQTGKIRLGDLNAIRANEAVSWSEYCANLGEFFSMHEDLFSGFQSDGFKKDYPFGVLRSTSLFDLFGIEKLNLKKYLQMIAANFKERKRVFKEKYFAVHRSGGVPIDDVSGLEVFSFNGLSRSLGKITITIKEGKDNKTIEREIFLTLMPGIGEGHLGFRLAFAVDHPAGQVMDVSWMLFPDKKGKFYPTIVKIQSSPFQLNKNLEYVADFISHENFPTRGTMASLQKEISLQLLNNADIFSVLLASISNFNKALGYEDLLAWPGEKNKWLIFHDDLALDSPKNKALERIWRMYDERYCKLGFHFHLASGLYYMSLNGGYAVMLCNGMQFSLLEQKKTEKVWFEDKVIGNRPKEITVPLPQYVQEISEIGLARVCDELFEMTGHDTYFLDDLELVDILNILDHIRIESKKIEEDREYRLFLARECGKEHRE